MENRCPVLAERRHRFYRATQLNATLLAIEELNVAGGVLSRTIEPIVYDPASKPSEYRRLAEHLMSVDQLRLVLGCYMSSTRKAVLPVIEGRHGLLFYPTLYEGFEYSANCIYKRCRNACRWKRSPAPSSTPMTS